MVARKSSGTIVNILSINAHCGAPDLAIYAATKGALSTLTKNAAHANLAERIRVNGINLGWTNTAIEHQMQSVVLGRGETWFNEENSRMPLGQLLDAKDAARLPVYLLSEVSAHMTGVALDLEQRVTGAPV
jgi:NAD(P)-dependent dehydrogenase (short-subunit alcohol dehydrogenase family)